MNSIFIKPGKTPTQMMKDLLAMQDQIITYSKVGNIYYCAFKYKDKISAGVCKTESYQSELMYKFIDETHIPYYYDCPTKILDLLTPTDNKNANTWREECINQKKIKYNKSKQLKRFKDIVNYDDIVHLRAAFRDLGQNPEGTYIANSTAQTFLLKIKGNIYRFRYKYVDLDKTLPLIERAYKLRSFLDTH